MQIDYEPASSERIQNDLTVCAAMRSQHDRRPTPHNWPKFHAVCRRDIETGAANAPFIGVTGGCLPLARAVDHLTVFSAPSTRVQDH